MSKARLELVAGARLDRYELLCPLGEGGMASIWLARLTGKRGFEQLVAIKTMRSHLSEDLRFEQMFLDEARIASRIRHPNVAQILDLGEEGGVLYIAMEWVDGESLSRVRRSAEERGEKIPLWIALRIAADACAGLHAAHELEDELGANLGVIHRDVSPQNILVSTSGSVKLIDFGIAKAKGRAVGETEDGLLKGKVAYMSPEQAMGMPLDRRTDIWALGVCLYELIAHHRPYEGDSKQEVHRKLTSKEPAPELPEGTPDVVRAAVKKALAHDRDARFPTAAAMERELERVLATIGQPTTSEDVASYLADTCGDDTGARRAMVTAAISGKNPKVSVSNRDDVSTASLSPVDQGGTEGSMTTPAHRTKPPSTLVMVVTGLAIIGAAAFGYRFFRAKDPEAPRPVTAATSAPSSAVSSAPPPAVSSAPPPVSVTASAPLPPRKVVQKPTPPPAKPSATAARPAVRYDPDGIPIPP